MSTLIVIPARWGSTRFPGKALANIAGLPMVVRTYRNTVVNAPGRTVLVATDDNRIMAACRHYDVPAVMTSRAHACGTDRVAEASYSRPQFDTVLVVQGDEPCMAPGVIDAVEAETIRRLEVCCGMCEITAPADRASRNVGKVVCDSTGHALWIDRAPLAGDAVPAYTQVCCYGFLRDDLLEFARMPVGRYEQATGIELLRWIEAGYRLRMVPVPGGRHAVDCPADIAAVEALCGLGSVGDSLGIAGTVAPGAEGSGQDCGVRERRL